MGVWVAALTGAARGGRARASGHDEVEPEESKAQPADNPYDEAPAPRVGMARAAVVAQDGMLKLPGGRFVMGSASPRAPANERPARPVVVGPFWIDQTQVTVGAYRACVHAAAAAAPPHTSRMCPYGQGDPDPPPPCVHCPTPE